MDMGTRIHNLRLEKGLTLEELGDKVGVGKSTVRKWEVGAIANMRRDKILLIAEALGTTPAYLMGWPETDNVPTVPIEAGFTIPVLGRVAAGYGKAAIEEKIDEIEISPKMASKGEYFGLVIKGDSMEPGLHENDVVIVQKDTDVDTGDLVIALVNGSDATCKRLQRYAEGLALIPLNPAYEPMRFTEQELVTTPVHILGKVVEMRRKF